MVPVIILQYHDVVDKPFWNIDKNNDNVNNMWSKLKEATGYQFDNNKTFIQLGGCGDLFSFSIRAIYTPKFKAWDLHIWDYKGITSITNFTVPLINKETDVFTKEVYYKLDQKAREFLTGKIDCSKCHTQLNKNEVAGTFFAGSYCVKCWEGGMKREAALENYD